MKKLIADGKIKKIERKLLNHIEKEYESADGNMWAEIGNIYIDREADRNFLTFTVRYGRANSEKFDFTREFNLGITDGNADFIVGQIAGAIQVHEELGW